MVKPYDCDVEGCGWLGNSRQARYSHYHFNHPGVSSRITNHSRPAPTPVPIVSLKPVEPLQSPPEPIVEEGHKDIVVPENEDYPKDFQEQYDEDEEEDDYDYLLLPVIILILLVAGLYIVREKIFAFFEKFRKPPMSYGVPDYHV